MINNKNPLPLITYKKNPKCKKTILWYIKNNKKKKKIMRGGSIIFKIITGGIFIIVILIICLYLYGLFKTTKSGGIIIPVGIIFTINFIYSIINKYMGKYLKNSNVSKKSTVEDVRYVKKEIKKLILSIPDIVPIFEKLPKHKKNAQPFRTYRQIIKSFKIPEGDDEFSIKVNLPTVEVPFLHPLNAACCGFLRFSELIMGVIDKYIKPLVIRIMKFFKPVKEFIEKMYNEIKIVLKILEDLKNDLIDWLFDKVDGIVSVFKSVPLISDLLKPVTDGIEAEKTRRKQEVLESERKRKIRNAEMDKEQKIMNQKMALAKSDASTKTSTNYKKISGGGVNYYDSINNALKSIEKKANLEYRKKCYKIIIMYKKKTFNLRKNYKIKTQRKKCLNNECVKIFKELYICVDNLKKETANLHEQTNNIINIQKQMKGGFIDDLIDAASSITDAIADAANTVGDAAKAGYEAAKEQALDWASGAAAAALKAFNLAKKGVEIAIKAVEAAIKKIFDLTGIIDTIGGIGTTIAAIPGQIADEMSSIFNKIGEITVKVGDAIIKFPIIGNLIIQIGKLIKWFLTDIIGRGVDVIDAILDLVNELTGSIPIPSWLSKDNPILKIPPILTILESIVKIPAKEFFETTWGTIKKSYEAFNMDWLDDLISTFKSGINSLLEIAKTAYNVTVLPALTAAEIALKVAEGVCKAATFGQGSCSFEVSFSETTNSQKSSLGMGDSAKIEGYTPLGPWISTAQNDWFVTKGELLDLDIKWEDGTGGSRHPYVKTTGSPRVLVGQLKKSDGSYNTSKTHISYHNTSFMNDNGNFKVEKELWQKGKSYAPPGEWRNHCDNFFTTFNGHTLKAKLVKPIINNPKWIALMDSVKITLDDNGNLKFPEKRQQEDECSRLFKEQKGIIAEFEYDEIRVSDQDDRIDYDYLTGKFKLNERRVPWPDHHRPFGKWHEKAHRDKSSENGRIPLNGTHLRAFIYNKRNKLVYQSINIEHIYDEFEVNENRELYCSWRHPHNTVEFWNAERRTKDRPGPPPGVGWDDPVWVSRGRGPDEDRPL
tara:strand:+ start:1130 stop:4288 length:3159 start_codon:yes stop_codon:yes gene_type:complete